MDTEVHSVIGLVGIPIEYGVDSFLLFNSYGAIYVLDNEHYLFTDIIVKFVLFFWNKYGMNDPKIQMTELF